MLHGKVVVIGVTVAQVLCSERHDAVQGKSHHQQVEKLDVRPASLFAPKGERQACVGSVAPSKVGGLCTSTPISGIGHGQPKHIYALSIVADERALKRLGISRNIREKSLRITAFRKRIADCFEAQSGEGWKVEMS